MVLSCDWSYTIITDLFRFLSYFSPLCVTEYAQKVGSIVSHHVITLLKRYSRGTKPELLVNRLVATYFFQILNRNNTKSGGYLLLEHGLGLVYDCLRPTRMSFIQFMIYLYPTQTLPMVSQITSVKSFVLRCPKILDTGTTYIVVFPVSTYANGIKSHANPKDFKHATTFSITLTDYVLSFFPHDVLRVYRYRYNMNHVELYQCCRQDFTAILPVGRSATCPSVSFKR